MKKKAKFPVIFVLILMSLFTITTCDTSVNDPIPKSPYLGESFSIEGVQLCERDNYSNKLSTMHKAYTGTDRTINAYVSVDHTLHLIGDGGEIKNGKFSIEVPSLSDGQISNCNDFLEVFFSFWYSDMAKCNLKIIIENVPIAGDEKIATAVNFLADPYPPPKDMLMREGFSGTQTSLSAEEIYYIYVKYDCTITANEGGNPAVGYIYSSLDLPLKKGWNTVCMKETYTVFGISTYAAEVKNPDFEWVMMVLPDITT